MPRITYYWSLALLALFVVSCAASGAPGDFREAAGRSSTELRVVGSQDGSRLIDSTNAGATHRPVVGEAKLRYEFRGADGKVVEEGHVPDPRALRSEWITGEKFETEADGVTLGLYNCVGGESSPPPRESYGNRTGV